MRSPGVAGDAQITATYLPAAHFGYSPTYGNNQIVHLDLGEVRGLGTGLRYDRQGRLSRIWTPNDATVRMIRDRFGRLVRHVDPQGRSTFLGYDALDRLVRVVDPEGNATVLSWPTTRWAASPRSPILAAASRRTPTTTWTG